MKQVSLCPRRRVKISSYITHKNLAVYAQWCDAYNVRKAWDSVSTPLKLHMWKTITEGTQVLWKESVRHLQTTLYVDFPVVKVLLKCVIRFSISFRWTHFRLRKISRPLAYGVRISWKASATAGAPWGNWCRREFEKCAQTRRTVASKSPLEYRAGFSCSSRLRTIERTFCD